MKYQIIQIQLWIICYDIRPQTQEIPTQLHKLKKEQHLPYYNIY